MASQISTGNVVGSTRKLKWLNRIEIDGGSEDDPREVERQRLAYLRQHRERLQQRYRLEAERRVEELQTDVAAMKARRDEVRAIEEGRNASGSGKRSALKTGSAHAASCSGIYARIEELGVEELQLLAKRYETSGSQAQTNLRGKYHSRFMKDAYPIAGSQLKLEKENELGAAAKKKLLLTDTAVKDTSSFEAKRKRGSALSNGLGQDHSHSKLEHYIGKITTTLQDEQEKVRREEADRQLRLAQVKHRAGLEQFWRLMHAGPKREVISWLKFHSFLDVNIPVRVAPRGDKDDITIHEDKTLGLTPLMAACRSLCVELVHCLLEHGAVVWPTTANGDTAMHFLWRNWQGSTESLKDVANLALRTQRVHDILIALVDQGADVDAQNVFGETALQFCARYGLVDAAKLLLRNGADAFVRDRKGFSAVQYALDGHFERLHQLLLHHDTIERTRAREKEWHETNALLKQKRGALTATLSRTADDFFTKLQVEQQRAGHLRNQYVNSKGQVIVCEDEDE